MTTPAWVLKLAAAAVIPVMVGMGVALSAPAPRVNTTDILRDDTYRPGTEGVDFASVTGPVAPRDGRQPACADPASGLAPCLK
ncbi:hypothetical protein [Neoaquamicrobium sediminum]|uniref:Uncharacterized protein n=1 Tax=Neoaquamicrobium sediminum TaxID=1849104 RepID=A0ABV3WM94_9HYPH